MRLQLIVTHLNNLNIVKKKFHYLSCSHVQSNVRPLEKQRKGQPIIKTLVCLKDVLFQGLTFLAVSIR